MTNQPDTIPARKLPKYIGVEPLRGRSDMFMVYITKHMAKTVPEWVRLRHLTFWWESEGKHRTHAYTYIYAKDELEAFTRFCRLWRAMPTE